MIVKFSSLYKNYLKGENRIKIIFFLAFLIIFLSQYYGRKILWIMIISGALAIIQLYFIIKQMRYIEKFDYIFLRLEDTKFKIINDSIMINKVKKCNMDDKVIEIIDFSNKRYTISLKWIEENKREYVIDYFDKIRKNIKKKTK
ncbi:hypothetical protein [Clostridium oceanicum]|uniref:YcxB-like protein domain-containing protein n=1 Tax=Clostridium oceanicum TaxID=1543 RepID=A0ABN1JIL2_9CLOT